MNKNEKGQIASNILLGILVLGLLVGLGWAATYNQWLMYNFFGIRFENTRRQIFEHSHAYNQGMIQELENMEAQYVTATPEQKQLLGAVILQRVGEYPNELPPDLQNFVNQIRKDRGLATNY